MDKSLLPRARLGNHEHLKNREYYVAWMDELDIEAALLHRLENSGAQIKEDPVASAMREALTEIDKLKVNDRLDAERTRLQQLPEIKGLSRTFDRMITRVLRDDSDFLKNWTNLREGMDSPDPDQAERFNRFYETAGLGPKAPREIVDLIAVLEPAKTRKKPGRKPIAIPKWRNDTASLDEMLVLVNGGLSVKAASEKVAETEASGRENSRAKRLANFYGERQKLR